MTAHVWPDVPPEIHAETRAPETVDELTVRPFVAIADASAIVSPEANQADQSHSKSRTAIGSFVKLCI
uniref:hypothetical protein n=1 Tax=Caballeronia telluris TaxID=326475 RepID=UPI000B3E7349|nr:hypothetical protein [Caballeronia telluris]